ERGLPHRGRRRGTAGARCHADRQRPRRVDAHHARRQRPRTRRGDRDVRQGRPVGSRRRRPADGAHRRPHGRRDRGVTGGALRSVAERLVRDARAAGARAADALAGESDGLEVGVRLRAVEKIKRARERRAGLRVFVGDSTAVVSTADLSADGLSDLARDACALARATAADRFAALPDAADLAPALPDLALYDPAIESLDAESALRLAREAEAAALSAAPEIDNSEGAEFGGGGGQVAYASSLGFIGAYSGSSLRLPAAPAGRPHGRRQR